MKQMIQNAKWTTLILALIFGITVPAMAASDAHSGHSHATSQEHSMDHSSHMGDLIHESTVDGYHFAYHVMHIADKMAGVKGKEHITHHLMVYITDANGKTVDGAKVGYLITGPGDAKQKAMCMGMGGGFGADVSFKEKGKYTVKTKAVIGDVKLMDTMEYEVK